MSAPLDGINKPRRKANPPPQPGHQGEHLQAFLEAKGISPTQLANALQKKLPTITGYFEPVSLRSATRAAIARLLGESQEVIFGLAIPRPSEGMEPAASQQPDEHQGRQLRTYLDAYSISYQRLAGWLGCHTSSVHNYVKRAWLKPSLRQAIIDHLHRQGYPDANALSVFGDWMPQLDKGLLKRLAQAHQWQWQHNAGGGLERLLLELHSRVGQISGQVLTERSPQPANPSLAQDFVELAARALLLSEIIAPEPPASPADQSTPPSQ